MSSNFVRLSGPIPFSNTLFQGVEQEPSPMKGPAHDPVHYIKPYQLIELDNLPGTTSTGKRPGTKKPAIQGITFNLDDIRDKDSANAVFFSNGDIELLSNLEGWDDSPKYRVLVSNPTREHKALFHEMVEFY